MESIHTTCGRSQPQHQETAGQRRWRHLVTSSVPLAGADLESRHLIWVKLHLTPVRSAQSPLSWTGGTYSCSFVLSFLEETKQKMQHQEIGTAQRKWVQGGTLQNRTRVRAAGFRTGWSCSCRPADRPCGCRLTVIWASKAWAQLALTFLLSTSALFTGHLLVLCSIWSGSSVTPGATSSS